MANDFARNPSAERFQFLGMKTNDVADAFPSGKYPVAINVRGTSESSIQTRPGYLSLFTTAPAVITDVRAYGALFTDDLPRYLAADANGKVFLDTSAQVGSLAGTPPFIGTELIPFRPNASPQPWMYIANGADYQKFSSPSVGVVTQSKVGIAEPQAAPDAAIIQNFQGLIGGFSATQGGTAGAPTNGNRVSDTAGTVLQDPTGAAEWTVQVGSASSYQKLMEVTIGTNVFMVIDVFAALPSSINMQSIFYFTGSTGRCIIVPQTISGESGEDQSVFQAAFLTTLRRGAMLVVGSEKVYVWSVSPGPNGSISIETSTTGTHTTAETLTTLPAISVIPSAPVKFATAATAAGSNTYSGFSTGGQHWSGTPSVVAAMAALDGNFATVPLVTTGPPFPPFASGLMALQNFGFAIPPAATILGVAATIYAKASPANGQTFYNGILLLKAGVISGHPSTGAGSDILQSALTPTTFGSSLDLWSTSLTPTDINNSGFGITMQVSNNGGNTTVSVDWVNIIVYYTLPAGGGPPPAPVLGQAITDPDITYQVTTGTGTMTNTTGANPFNIAGASFQPEDYLSLGIKVDNLSNLTELKFLLDVGDGSFTQNFYYYSIRPSDIAAAVANSVTGLAASQTSAQRATIDAEVAAISAQAGYIDVNSGTQLLPGSSQWTEVVFPLSALIRVGSDQTKSLQTLAKIQYLWVASGTINVATDIPFVFGGFQADVGDQGAPLQYRVRPRARTTGVVGNPSPASRYGVSPRRGRVTVYLPSALYDAQIDTWDVFRYGGAVTSWRFVGSVPAGSAVFEDNFDDAAAEAGDALDFDNFEPWPSVGLPNTGTAPIVNGTVATINTIDPQILNYLPGTLVELGGLNVYTLWARPTLISGSTYLLQFVENAGAGANVSYIIQEPFLADQHLPYMWGPDASGTVFACGDQFRPGSIYFSKSYAPDSAPDTYNQEIVQPSEPLLGGETVDGLAFVASSARWWALYPQPDNPSQRYNVVQQPVPRGLASPYGHCTDNRTIFFWAEDGIWSTVDGSLTDADLYTLFPHDGVVGTPFSYDGFTIQPPDYSRAGAFRLAYANYYLYATYLDSTGAYHTLVCDLRRKAWSIDLYAGGLSATVFYNLEQQSGTVLTQGTLYAELLAAFKSGGNSIVGQQQDLTNDIGNPIACALATREDPGGDVRAPKQWGDFFVDLIPAATPGGVTVQPFSLAASIAAATVIPTSATRQRTSVSVGGTVVSDFMGLMFAWTDDFTQQSTWTKLRIWQPSYTIQPPGSVGWTTFGTSFGLDGYMHIQRLSIAYVSTAPITVTVTSYDGQSPAPITLPSTGGVYQKTYFPLSANKGQLYKIRMTSTAKFQIFSEDSHIYVGGWGRTGPYLTPQNFGGSIAQPSPI